MVRVTNPSHVKAARLRESGIEWSIALVKAKVPGTDLTRKSERRIPNELFFDPARQQRVLDPALMSMPTSSMVQVTSARSGALTGTSF
jgi:hypothetical protein